MRARTRCERRSTQPQAAAAAAREAREAGRALLTEIPVPRIARQGSWLSDPSKRIRGPELEGLQPRPPLPEGALRAATPFLKASAREARIEKPETFVYVVVFAMEKLETEGLPPCRPPLPEGALCDPVSVLVGDGLRRPQGLDLLLRRRSEGGAGLCFLIIIPPLLVVFLAF